MISVPEGRVRAIGVKWREGRWLRGSRKTENRMDGLTERLPSSLARGGSAAGVVAMTVPVVADRDRVMLRRPAKISCVSKGIIELWVARRAVDRTVVDCSLSEAGLERGGSNEFELVGTSVKRRELMGLSKSAALVAVAASVVVALEEEGLSEWDRVRPSEDQQMGEVGGEMGEVAVGFWELRSRVR